MAELMDNEPILEESELQVALLSRCLTCSPATPSSPYMPRHRVPQVELVQLDKPQPPRAVSQAMA